MTDYDLYWTGSRWDDREENLAPVKYDPDTVHDLRYNVTGVEWKTEDLDASALVSYTDMPWYDARGNRVASGAGNAFHKGDGYGPVLFMSGTFDRTGNNAIKISYKHKGSIFTDHAITFHVKVKNLTDLTMVVTDTWTETAQIDYMGTSVLNYAKPVRSGYELQGWYTGKDGSGTKKINSDGSVTGGTWSSLLPSMTLYAYWTERTYSVTTSFTNCSGSVSKASNVRWSETVRMTWTPSAEREGLRRTFASASFEGRVSSTSAYVALRSASSDTGSLDLCMGDVALSVLYTQVRASARYKYEALVRLYSSDGTMGVVGFTGDGVSGSAREKWCDTTSGYNTVKIFAAANEGYEFVSWSDGSTSVMRTLTVTSAKELTATFRQKQYTIYVKAGNNGRVTTPSSGSVKGPMGGIAPIVAQPSEGYELDVWKVPSTATVTVADPTSASTSITIGTSNDTVTATFKQSQTSIVLDANCNGGTDGSGTIKALATRLTVSTAPKRSDSTMWTLTEYYLDAACTVRIASKSSSYWVLDKDVVYRGTRYTDEDGEWQLGSGTATFYASWTGKELTVTLNPNGGTVSPTSKKVNFGGYYGDLPEPVNSDETLHFEGWYTAQSGGDRVDSSTLVTATSSHTIYAHWTTGYIVTFDANGGHTDEVRRTVIPGRAWGTLPTAAWTGHELLGWYTQQTGGVKIRSYDTVTITQNTTLWAHWRIYEHTFTLTYNANGGSGAPSAQTAVDSEDFHDFPVSASMPTRAGYEFVGWARSASAAFPEYLPSGTVRVEWNGTSASLTLYAVWMELQPSEGGDIDHVTVYKADATGKAPGTAHIDVSSRLTQRSVIRETESYGMTATFTIVNGETPQDNLLASTCVWSSGTGALDVGMFVRIRHGSETGMSWGWFFITSMSVSDDLISITCGDYIQWLRANGADYYRNHYNPASYNQTPEPVTWDAANSWLYVQKPPEATLVGGAAADVKVMTPGTESAGSVNPTEITLSTRSMWTTYHIRNDISQIIPDSAMAAIKSITIQLPSNAYTYDVSLYYEDDTTLPFAHGTLVKTSGSTWNPATFNLPNPISVKDAKKVTVKVTATGSSSGAQVKYRYVDKTGCTTKYLDAGLSEQTLNGKSLDMSFGMLFYDNAEGEIISSTRWKVQRVASGVSVDESFDDPVKDASGNDVPRGWIEYLDPSSGVAISEVVRSICGAADCSVALGSMNRSIQMFRCAGSYFHDYLLALADMTEASGSYAGRNHALCASQSAWASLMFGLRRRSTDGYSMTLYYGGDQSPGSGAIRMMSFDPKKTMQYRPCKAVSKGLDNDGNPILVCVKDPVVKLGSSAVTMESTDTSSVQAALNAYNTIIRNRSDAWEGEVVLDGIIPSVMSRMGVFIGGTVVRIYDSRYGMAGLKAKVREAVYDYQNLKTTLYLNNAPEDYSNSINDTSKMAYTSGTLSLAVSGEDMYLRQYVFLDVTGQLTVDPSASHTLTIEVSNGTPATTQQVTAEVIAYPELNICTLVGYFPPGTAYSTDRYAVTSVKVDNAEITIGSFRRPDKRDEQYLIVNVQCSI